METLEDLRAPRGGAPFPKGPLERRHECAMRANVTKTFRADSVEAQIAGDCWLYGHVFVLGRERYTITHYHLSGDGCLCVVVTLEPLSTRGDASH